MSIDTPPVVCPGVSITLNSRSSDTKGKLSER